MHEEQEITSDTISKYVNGLSKLSICTGKLDAVMLYLENNNIEDKFLLSSLDSVLKDILSINGDKQYIRMSLGSHNINIAPKLETKITSIPISTVNEGGLNTKKVQIPQKQIKQPLLACKSKIYSSKAVADMSENKTSKSIFHIFKNSSNLARVFHGVEDISFLKALKIEIKENETLVIFKNGRKYIYNDIPQNKIETLIACDKNNISPGRYFNNEIKNAYGFREVTHDAELVG